MEGMLCAEFQMLDYEEMECVNGGDAEDIARQLGRDVGTILGAAYNVVEFMWKTAPLWIPMMYL